MEKQTVRVLATGYFDSGNLGDDAMREALDAFLRESSQQHDVVWQPLPDSSVRDWRAVLAFAAAIRRSDRLLLVGGTHFHDAFGGRSIRILLTFFLVFAYSRLVGCRPSSVAVGIGPLDTRPGRVLVGSILRISQVTMVRDVKSLEVAKAVAPSRKFKLGSDLAFLLPVSPDIPLKRRVLGVSIFPYFSYLAGDEEGDARYVARLAQVLDAGVREGYVDEIRILVVCHSKPGGDEEISTLLLDRLKELNSPVSIAFYLSPSDTLREMSQLRYFICSRYHALLLSQLQALPVVVLPYQDKCVSLADQLAIPEMAQLKPEAALHSTNLATAVSAMLSGEISIRNGAEIEARRSDAINALSEAMQDMGLMEVQEAK